MAVSLEILKTYNCRTVSGVVKRGNILNDWLRYGVYYGTPAYLHIHDFDNWDVLVFDFDVLAQGVDPADYAGMDVYVYLAFGGRFDLAARQGGYNPPDYNADKCEILREAVHREIDEIIDAGFAGIFWDECDTGFWDWSYCLESSNIMKSQLQEYCDYVRVRGGKNFINGTPWFAECGENFLLESFLSTWSSNLFAPDWAQNDLFIKYTFGLEELGELGGIPWSTGIYSWLYLKEYAPQVKIFAHSYGDPESVWQHDKQDFSLAGALAIGLQSYNYIEPTNQTLVPIWAHNFYVGAPLECPQFDVTNRTVTRKYTGASVTFDEKASKGTIDMNVNPDYWWNINQEFKDINWEVDGTQVEGANRYEGSIPDYLKINNVYFYDDRLEVYFRLKMKDMFEEADIIPLYFYICLDSTQDGYQTALTIKKIPYLHLKNINVQVYLYGKSLFYWDRNKETSSDRSNPDNWEYLYPVRYEIDIDTGYIYYAVRKETLKFVVPSWDEEYIKIIPFFLYGGGSSFFTNDFYAVYDGCLPETTMDYRTQYTYIEWIEGGPDATSENKLFANCPLPVFGSEDELEYNQFKLEKTISTYLYEYCELTWYLTSDCEDVWIHYYTLVHNFTVYGYGLCQCQLKAGTYVPHSAVIYNIEGQINKKITQVDITGNFDKAWVFDRENGQFVGPDDTPDTYFTSSPFSPTKIIDGQDIYVAISHDNTSSTADTWNVSDVSVTLANWAETHEKGYDIALPDLIKWQSVYDEWKGAVLSETVEQEYLPAGIKRGGISSKRDDVKSIFTITVAASSAIVDALEIYDITNATLLMRRTYEDLDHNDPDNIELLVWAYVDTWELTDTELRIRAKLNFHNWGAMFPKRRLSYFCPFVFKGPQCNYGGGAIACDKTLTTCKSLDNDANFGGMPTLPRLQRGSWGG